MRTPGSRPKHLMIAAAALAAAAMTPHPAAATTDITAPLTSGIGTPSTTTAHVIEWDLTSIPDQLDLQAGAVSTDTRGEDHNQLWFVSRLAAATDPTLDGQRIYRFNPSESLYKADARWTAWGLRVDTFVGGLKRVKPSHDRRYVFVRSAQFIQRIDTRSCSAATSVAPATCERVVYVALPAAEPPGMFVSDIATDDRNRVFTTGFTAGVSGDLGYVQMIDPAAAAVYDAVKNTWTMKGQRWLDDGAGQCLSGPTSGFCNAGIDVHPGKQNLVYFVEVAGDGFIAELNIANSKPSVSAPNIRRWSLAQLGAATGDTISQPRVLKIDRSGKIWINTGSGHLVSLDPATNRMTKHLLPDGASNDPWAVAPDDDVVGYTGAQTHKVAMMFPKRKPVTIYPSTGVAPIEPVDILVQKERAELTSGTVPGEAKIVATKITSNTDGLFIEGLINTGTSADSTSMVSSEPSLVPLGITANRSKSQGSFFYTVGGSGDATPDPAFPDGFPPGAAFAKRVGHIRLPMKDRAKFPRDDDDADDGFDRNRHPKWHNSEPEDEDADAVPDRYDTPSSRDNMSQADATPVAAGQVADYQVVTSASPLALIAAVQPDNAMAVVAVDVYNTLGTLVGTSGPVVGLATATVPTPGAGTFTVRVRNLSAVPVTCTPTFVVREPAVPLP